MIKVLKAGFFTTIQDTGRVGFGSFGVPISGVMDAFSSNLANHILNNSLNDAVLEIAFSGCEFQFLTTTTICISGANFSPTINKKKVSLNTRITIYENDILSFGKIMYGNRCYLAVKGGFLSEKIMNSRSFYKNITIHNKVQKDDYLSIYKKTSKFATANTIVKVDENHFKSSILECYKGPEFEFLSLKEQQQLLNINFTISKDNSRMGYKLDEKLVNNLPQILSGAVLPGTVQLTPSGTLIVLMKDCQITGGYCRVLHLTEKSISRLAQKTTGNFIQFKLKLI